MNITPIDSATDPGSQTKPNEDRIVIAENLFVVLDGATGLGRQLIESHPSDAVWFVETFSTQLIKYWRVEYDFTRAVSGAIDACIDEYTNYVGGEGRPDFERPSAGMVATVIENGGAQVFRLGDCTAYYKEGGNAESLFDQSPLEILDRRAIEAMTVETRSGKNSQQARDAILPMLQSHRSLMNKPGGYGALSLTPDCLNYIDSTSIAQMRGAFVLMATDGFSAIEHYKGYAAADIFESCESLGLSGVIREIREIENHDSGLEFYPRLKPHDDATAMLLSIGD